MKKTIALAAAASLCAALVGVATPAGATSTTVYSAAGYAATGTIAPTATVTGSLGNLVGPFLNPVLSGLVNPLLSGLTALPQNLVSGLTTSLVGGLNAYANTAATTADQGSSFPSCTGPFALAYSCYHAASLPVAAPPVVAASVSAANGYAQNVNDVASKPVVGAAGAAVTALSLLGVPIMSGGTLTSKASCPTTGSDSPTASSTASNLSLLGGAVTATTGGSGNLTSVMVNGSPLATVSSLTVSGLPVTVSLNGNLLKLAITLSVSQLLAGLGISVSSSLLDDVTSSSLTLTVTVGPGTTTSSSGSASAWGLDVGVDVAGSVGINVLGLATVAISIPSGLTSSGGGNALDLKLAYSSCTATPATTGTQAVPPGVN